MTEVVRTREKEREREGKKNLSIVKRFSAGYLTP